VKFGTLNFGQKSTIRNRIPMNEDDDWGGSTHRRGC